jgi:hemin uptake protein HemP
MSAGRDDSPGEKEESVHPQVHVETRAAAPGGVRVIRARDLLGPERILRIEHDGQVYTLRITRNDRLILTK